MAFKPDLDESFATMLESFIVVAVGKLRYRERKHSEMLTKIGPAIESVEFVGTVAEG